MSNREREIDRQAEMLSDIKLAKHYDDVLEGKAKSNVAKIGDFGLYECHFPLPDQKDYLKNYMFSLKTPTGQEWLDITPIDAVKQEADNYKTRHGIDVSVEAFNSYQRVRNNPDLITFKRLSAEEKKDLFRKNKEGN
tara:strand:+ start:405 stop:815 length:411 start_codon:yes stop_codon:yes gene_type:complete